MKKKKSNCRVHLVKFLFFFIVFFSIVNYPQSDEKTIKLNRYLAELKKFQSNREYLSLNKVSNGELKRLMKIAYEAKEISDPELNNLFVNEKKRYVAEMLLKGENADIEQNLGVIDGMILHEIRKRYSLFYYYLVRIPVFLTAQVLDIDTVNQDGFWTIFLSLKPELKIKGKLDFLDLDTFKVYYRNYEAVLPENDYKIENTYLFPLFDRGEIENPEYAVATFIDGRGFRFLIKGNILYDNNNFFKSDKQIPIDIAIKKLRETIYSIINTEEGRK